MILTKTITVKLDTSKASILPTIVAYTKAFNHVCTVGFNDNNYNKISLHHKTYQYCRTFLPSQLSCSAKDKASESLKGINTLKKKGYKISCPKSKQCSIRYDHNSYNVWLDKKILSISTVNGRQKFNFQTSPNLDQYKDWRRKSAELYIKNKKVMMGITFEKEVTDSKSSNIIVGIDRGIKKIAVTSNNQFFGGGQVKQVVQHYRSLRKRLQSKGTQSAKRHLRRLSEKENRFRQNVNHCVSKQIVNSLSPGTTIVLEDLTNIRENSQKFRKEQNYWINGWSFFQLESFLKYKAMEKGCFIDFVDARYTSQKCSKCGHTERGNRKKQSIFKCKKCSFELNADLNAARNIKFNYQDAKGYLGRVPVNEPIVCKSLEKSNALQAPTFR